MKPQDWLGFCGLCGPAERTCVAAGVEYRVDQGDNFERIMEEGASARRIAGASSSLPMRDFVFRFLCSFLKTNNSYKRTK